MTRLVLPRHLNIGNRKRDLFVQYVSLRETPLATLASALLGGTCRTRKRKRRVLSVARKLTLTQYVAKIAA
jgi:hypothetical protein